MTPLISVRRALVACVAAVALAIPFTGVASAHAHLVQADPAPGAVIARAPAVASFVFDEALNPALTRVRLADSAGRSLAAGGQLAPGHGGELWRLALPRLAPGTYSVFWTSESATDGHVMSSFYTFRVAPSGTAAALGAAATVTTAAAGPPIDGQAVAITAFIWLGLMAQALWLGALVVELVILTPARRRDGTAEAHLAWAATPRLWNLARVSPPVVILALVGQILSLALAGTGGDWARALAPTTLGGILSSQNGTLMVFRIVALILAVRLTGRVRAPAAAPVALQPWPRAQRMPYALGITAAPLVPLQLDWAAVRLPVTILAGAYMLVAAFSGHAANVAPALLWQSCTIDWLHLVCTAAWAGGMAALAYGVLPARRALAADQRAEAVLPLLDRFSPVAYVAVGVLALSGFYSATHHLDAPSMLTSTLYGQILVVKLVLVGLLVLLSGSHVLWLRPRISRARYRATLLEHPGVAAQYMASVHEGLATLASRLRLEAWVGAAILLATALMSQTLPADGAGHGGRVAATTPGPINGVVTRGDLRALLTVASPMVGTTTFTVRLWEQGRPITGDTGAAIVHLFPAAQPTLRAVLTPDAHGTRFTAQGSLAVTGMWHADLLVRTVTVNEYRTLPFVFVVGPHAHFVAAQPATGHTGVMAAMAGM